MSGVTTAIDAVLVGVPPLVVLPSGAWFAGGTAASSEALSTPFCELLWVLSGLRSRKPFARDVRELERSRWAVLGAPHSWNVSETALERSRLVSSVKHV